MDELDFSIDGMIKMQLHNSDKISGWLMYETRNVRRSVLDNLKKNPEKGTILIRNFGYLVKRHVFITDKRIFWERWEKGCVSELFDFVSPAGTNKSLAEVERLNSYKTLKAEMDDCIWNICQKSEDELFEAYQDQRIDPTNKYIKIINQTEEFHNFLNSSDEVLLAEKLKELYSGKKGKDIAIMIIALEKLDKIRYTNRTKLYNSIRQTFGDIGSDSGINEYLTPYKTKIATNRKPILTDSDIQPFITKIKSLGC